VEHRTLGVGLFMVKPRTLGNENGDVMTDTHELQLINEALSIIDKGLGDMLHRELVSTDEVADLLLDVRTALLTTELPVSELDGAGAAAN